MTNFQLSPDASNSWQMIKDREFRLAPRFLTALLWPAPAVQARSAARRTHAIAQHARIAALSRKRSSHAGRATPQGAL
jgi:hypothetical protein